MKPERNCAAIHGAAEQGELSAAAVAASDPAISPVNTGRSLQLLDSENETEQGIIYSLSKNQSCFLTLNPKIVFGFTFSFKGSRSNEQYPYRIPNTVGEALSGTLAVLTHRFSMKLGNPCFGQGMVQQI